MKKTKIKVLNKIYFLFLIFVLILSISISFKSGERVYYLVNTNLDDETTAVNTGVADWKIEVTIEY